MKTKPYAKLTKIEKEYKFQVHLFNPTENIYAKVLMESGAYTFFDEKLVPTETINKEFGELIPNGSLLVDESDLGELDFKIWYKFQLLNNEGEIVEQFEYSI